MPHVAWMEDPGDDEEDVIQTFVKKLVNGAWTQVGTGPAESDPTKDGLGGH